MVGLQLITEDGAIVEVKPSEDSNKVCLIIDLPEGTHLELPLIVNEAQQIGCDLIASSQMLTSTSYQE